MNVIKNCDETGSNARCIEPSPYDKTTFYITNEAFIVMKSKEEEVGKFDLFVSSFEPVAENSFCDRALPLFLGESQDGFFFYFFFFIFFF